MATEFTQPQGFGRRPENRGRPPLGRESERRAYPERGRPQGRLPANVDPQRVAQGLGWFSIGLGLAAMLAPRGLGNAAGIGERNVILRGVGVREIAAGVGILTQRDPTPWLWSRVIGDMMDLTLLTTGLRPGNPGRGKAAASVAAVAGITALDVLTALQFTQRSQYTERRASRRPLLGSIGLQADVYVEKSMAINKPPQECYRFWRNLENLPRFMESVESVRAFDERRSHWVVKGPTGARVEWDSEITEDRPGEAIAWHSTEGSQVAHAGSVHFDSAPVGRGTIVRVSMHYSPVGGRLTATLTKIMGGNPQAKIKEDLRRFKQLLEAGEIPTVRGQPSGRRSLLARATREGRLIREWGLT